MTLPYIARIVAIIFAVLALVFVIVGGPWVVCLVVAAIAALVSLLTGSRTL